MDERNNDALQGNEALTENEIIEEATTEAVSSDDALKTELEELRDLFQQELDAASESAEDEDFIQQLCDVDANEEEEASEEDAKICECCEECAVSKDYGEDYPYCDACREAMKRYPLRASGFFMAIAMVVAFFCCAYVSLDYMTPMTTVSEGSTYYSEGKLTSAMYTHYNYISSASQDTVSMRAVRELIDCFDKTGYSSEVGGLIERYYSETALKMPWNKKYADLLEHTKVLEETYYAVNGEVEDALNGAKFDYDEYIAKLDALKEVNPKELGESDVTEQYNEVFIEYYKYILMSLSGKDVKTQLEQLAYIDSIDKNNMQWAYLSNYCAVAARSGDLELTTSLYNRLLEINKEDPNAYTALASFYRFEKDVDKMLEICAEAEKNGYSEDKSYQMQRAIAYALKGEGSVALEEMTTYMNSSQLTVQSCNLYALLALYNGNNDIYEEMKATLENAGYELSEIVTEYKNGNLTIEEALTDKRGDI